jgi:hypothetical protein
MPKCIYCGAETKLLVMGRPICVDCVKDIEEGRAPSVSEERNVRALPN